MLKINRTGAMSACVCLFAMFSIASVTMAIGGGIGDPIPQDNCTCGPVNDCNGIPLTASAYCRVGESCSCDVVLDANNNNCIVALDAICYTPA